MNIIYDNIIFSLQKAGGISLYWSELCKRVVQEAQVAFYGYKHNNIFAKKIRQEKENAISYKIARYLPFFKKLPKNSIFHSSYYRISNQKNVVNITTVHDFTYEYYKGSLARAAHSWQKGRAIKKSDGIICISENTKKDLQKFYPDVASSKIKVIYNGVNQEYRVLSDKKEQLEKNFKELSGKKYILYVGDRSSYKNFNVIIGLKNTLKEMAVVVVGGASLTKVEKEGLNNRYFHYQKLDAKDLNILYNNAFCLLYPSSHEGFGIPLVEAMSSGCPVVCSSSSSIPEVAGDAALLVDSLKIDDFKNAILKLENISFREKLIQKGLKRAENFSWDRCFEETYKFYEEVLSKKI